MERNYRYDKNTNLISVAEIEKALLEYFDEEEIDNRGCSCGDGRWFSLQTVMDAIIKNI